MVAKARRILDAPPRYLAQVKTDCLLTQRLPKRFAERLRALEAQRPKQRRWNGVDDPLSHCLAGNSLLLTGLPGTGKTHLARTIVARLREQGEAVHLVSKTHCSAQNLGMGAQTADHWVRRHVRGGSAQKLDWLVVEEITQLDMALWADLACVGLNADVKFLLLGDFRQLPAVLDSWAGRPISAPLEHSQLVRDLAGGHRHELTENMRSDPGIFNFVKWLRVGEEACPTLEQAKARLRELFPSKPGWPDTTLVISHSKRMAVNAAANRALAPEASKLLELEVIHMGCYESVPTNGAPQNSPQSRRVWPGLRLIGAGGKIPKGVFVAVAEVEPDGVRLDNGMRLKNQELLRATRPSHAVTYASCQGLTLHNRVRLDLESCHLTLRHLYVPQAPSCWRPRTGSTAPPGAPRWRTSKSTPPCLAISHTCRASTSARPLRRANSAGRGTRLPAGSQKRQRSKSILHFTCLPLALTLTARCSWLSSSVRAAPGKGFWKMIMSSMTACSTPSVHSSRSVLLAKHTPTLLAPSSWKLPGSHSTLHVRLAHQRALTGVLYGHELPPLGIGLNVQPERKLHGSAFFIRTKKVRSDERASFHRRSGGDLAL